MLRILGPEIMKSTTKILNWITGISIRRQGDVHDLLLHFNKIAYSQTYNEYWTAFFLFTSFPYFCLERQILFPFMKCFAYKLLKNISLQLKSYKYPKSYQHCNNSKSNMILMLLYYRNLWQLINRDPRCSTKRKWCQIQAILPA